MKSTRKAVLILLLFLKAGGSNFAQTSAFKNSGSFPYSIAQGDSIEPIHKELQRMQRFIEPPPHDLRTDTCYHYSELLRLVIDKNSKVVVLELSDSAPAWLKRDIERQKTRKDLTFAKLDSMALKGKLRNCTLVFPLVLESVVFPCGTEAKKPNLPPNYFQFGGKNLKGNIIFGETVRFAWSTKYVAKEGEPKKAL